MATGVGRADGNDADGHILLGTPSLLPPPAGRCGSPELGWMGIIIPPSNPGPGACFDGKNLSGWAQGWVGFSIIWSRPTAQERPNLG